MSDQDERQTIKPNINLDEVIKASLPEGQTFTFEIDTSVAVMICPSCYGNRDIKVPMLSLPSPRRYVLPDKEVVGREDSYAAVCPSCGHQETEERKHYGW